MPRTAFRFIPQNEQQRTPPTTGIRHLAQVLTEPQNRAHRYAIGYAGRRYPVKQIISMVTGTPVSDFSGGEAAGDANQYVTSRGFAIVELRRRKPDWVRDELILALELYLRYGGNPPPKGSTEIEALSKTLNRLGRYLGIATEDRFRNVNGVY